MFTALPKAVLLNCFFFYFAISNLDREKRELSFYSLITSISKQSHCLKYLSVVSLSSYKDFVVSSVGNLSCESCI